jgi:hypothetical protein
MSSGHVLRQLDKLVAESRFSAMSALDFVNIFMAIKLCGISFGRGPKLSEELNRLLTDEWPAKTFETRPTNLTL